MKTPWSIADKDMKVKLEENKMARFLTQRLVSSFVSIIGATLVIFLLSATS